MYRIFLLTDNPDFTVTAAQLSCPEGIDFDYLILSNDADEEHKVSVHDYQAILNACMGKDFVILQISGNQAIYIMDVLMGEKDLITCHFIIMQSPLIDFYPKPNEDFYLDKTIRRKLMDGKISCLRIRPFLSSYFYHTHFSFLEDNRLQSLVISDVSVLEELLSIIIKGKLHNNVIYFLSENLNRQKETLLPLLNKLLKYYSFIQHIPGKLFRGTAYYKKCFQLDALRNFLHNTDKLQRKLLLFPDKNSGRRQNKNKESKINFIT